MWLGRGKDLCDLQAVATAGWAQRPLPNPILRDWRWGTPGARGHRQRGFFPSPQHSHVPKTPPIPPQTPPVCSICQGKAHHELWQKEQLPDRPFLRGFPSILPCHQGAALATSGCSPLTISPWCFLSPHTPRAASPPRAPPLASLPWAAWPSAAAAFTSLFPARAGLRWILCRSQALHLLEEEK